MKRLSSWGTSPQTNRVRFPARGNPSAPCNWVRAVMLTAVTSSQADLTVCVQPPRVPLVVPWFCLPLRPPVLDRFSPGHSQKMDPDWHGTHHTSADFMDPFTSSGLDVTLKCGLDDETSMTTKRPAGSRTGAPPVRAHFSAQPACVSSADLLHPKWGGSSGVNSGVDNSVPDHLW